MSDIVSTWEELEKLPDHTLLITYYGDEVQVYEKWNDQWSETFSYEHHISEQDILLPAKIVFQPDGESYPQGKPKPEPVRDTYRAADHQRSDEPVWDEQSDLTGQHVCITCYVQWPCDLVREL